MAIFFKTLSENVSFNTIFPTILREIATSIVGSKKSLDHYTTRLYPTCKGLFVAIIGHLFWPVCLVVQ